MILANAGTPFLWGIGLHLYFSNVLVSGIEAYYIWKKFRANSFLKIFGIILVANIFSALSGYFLYLKIGNLLELNLANLLPAQEYFYFSILLTFTFAVSIIIESPFYISLLPKTLLMTKKIIEVFYAHLISYSFLIVVFVIFFVLTVS